MKVSTDSLIQALTHSGFYLSGDHNGGVGIHCRDHHDGGRPFAYYDPAGAEYPGPAVASVSTIPALWVQASHHLTTHHRPDEP